MILIKTVNIKTWCLTIRTTKSVVELGCVSVRITKFGVQVLTITSKLYIVFGMSGSDHHMVGI